MKHSRFLRYVRCFVIAFGAVLLFVVAPRLVHARQGDMGAPQNDSALRVSTKPIAVLPFDFTDNEIVVSVKVNDVTEPLRFAVDSGSVKSGIEKGTAERLKLRLRDYPLFNLFGIKVRTRVRSVGYGEKGYTLQSAERVRLQVASTTGSLPISESTYLVTNLPELAPGHPTNGILGYDFLSKYVVAIDYVDHTLTLYDRKGYQYTGQGKSIPLEVSFEQPSVHAAIQPLIGVPFQAKLLLDTGNGDNTFLNGPFVKKRKILDTTPSIPFSSTGPAGSIRGRTVRMESLALGDYVVARPSVGLFQSTGGEAGNKDRDGGLGNTILSRFHVVLDLSGRRLFLQPNAAFAKPFPTMIYSGMTSKAVKEGFEISSVDAGSPGAIAGFRIGDTLLAVDDVLIAGMSADKYTAQFGNDTKHRYRIRRNGKEFILEMQRTVF